MQCVHLSVDHYGDGVMQWSYILPLFHHFEVVCMPAVRARSAVWDKHKELCLSSNYRTSWPLLSCLLQNILDLWYMWRTRNSEHSPKSPQGAAIPSDLCWDVLREWHLASSTSLNTRMTNLNLVLRSQIHKNICIFLALHIAFKALGCKLIVTGTSLLFVHKTLCTFRWLYECYQQSK